MVSYCTVVLHDICRSVIASDQLQNNHITVVCHISLPWCFVQLTDNPDVVATTVLSNFLESCVWSITESDFQTVDVTIRTFDINVQIVSIYSVQITLILNQVLFTSCLGQPMCSRRGICSNSWCLCEAGCYFFSWCCVVNIFASYFKWTTQIDQIAVYHSLFCERKKSVEGQLFFKRHDRLYWLAYDYGIGATTVWREHTSIHSPSLSPFLSCLVPICNASYLQCDSPLYQSTWASRIFFLNVISL